MNPDETMYKLVLSRKRLKAAVKILRVAFPKKKQLPLVAVTFVVEPPVVEIHLPGAVVEIPCSATHSFSARIPFSEFRQISGETYGTQERIELGFASGKLSVGNLSINLQDVHVSTNVPSNPVAIESVKVASPGAEPPQEVVLAATPQALDGLVGFPLVSAYMHMRRYSDPTLETNASLATIGAREKVNGILDRAERLLQPLGLRRSDIERLLDQRLGLTK